MIIALLKNQAGNSKLLLVTLFIFSITSILSSQSVDSVKKKETSFKLMFYNVENYFDSFDDSLTNDNEFLPQGLRNWNYTRFLKKRNNIYKTIMAVGGAEPPAIIGLCEIENRFVLNQLVYDSPFAKFDYRIIHEESPDARGIDVAMLYNPKVFNVIGHEAIAINFPQSPESKTRDILYVKGLVYNEDTLHVFVNHWPSRYGGELSSEPRRIYVAKQLALAIDQIYKKNRNAAIVVMGDFNDNPTDKSIKDELNAGKIAGKNRLINLMPVFNDNKLGTHKYEGAWGMLDQIMISHALLSGELPIFVKEEVKIFNADYLIQDDEKYLGKMPFRSFIGMKYTGGFSDHLPIFIKIIKKND